MHGHMNVKSDLGFVSIRNRRLLVYSELMANVIRVNYGIGTNVIDADI